MTKAFNLSQLANNVNSSGQLDGATGITGPVAQASSLATANFTVSQSGSKLIFYYGATAIASIDSTGNFIAKLNVTAYGTP